MMRYAVLRYVGGCAVAISVAVTSSTAAELRKQFRNQDAPQGMSVAETAELGDPLFLLVLKDHPDVGNLKEIEDLLQPDPKKRSLFVVDERIIAPSRGQNRRAVLTFHGTRPPNINLSPNVMLSVFFNSETFPESSPNLRFIEAWGWDQQRARFNFYRLDRTGTEPTLTWKFRGSTAQANIPSTQERRGTCFECHINGLPVMKELFAPWNNWHSQDSRIKYLDPNQPEDIRWPVALNDRFKKQDLSDGLSGAGDLESQVISAIQNALQERVRRNTEVETESSSLRLTGARDLLTHLFKLTEFNIISAPRTSNLHPLSRKPLTKPALEFAIPPSFFIKARLLGNRNVLNIGEAIGFPGADVAKVKPDEYRSLVLGAGVKINGVAGDAHFSWLVPEPGIVDSTMIEELVKSGAVHRQFVAAVMAVDLEQPLHSEVRAGLLEFVPDSYSFTRPSPNADPFDAADFAQHELTRETIRRLEAASPTGSALDFLNLLKMTNGPPRDVLMAGIGAYASELKAALIDGSTQDRRTKLKQLYDMAVSQRKGILDDCVLGQLDETRGTLLFPLP